MTDYYLVINLGLTTTRAIVYDSDGEIITSSWYPIKTMLSGNTVEQDPNEWWKLIKISITDILKNQTIGCYIHYVTVTSSSSCLILIDKAGSVLYPAIMVSDKRAGKQAKNLKELVDSKKLFQNVNFLPEPSFMIPKILWVKDNLPEIYKRSAHFLSSNDYLNYKLSGKIITDSLNAEKYYYDQNKKEYPERLLKFLKIDVRKFPQVMPIGTKIGKISLEIEKLGLYSDTSVILSTYDAICAFWGSGISEEGEAGNVIGTVSSFRVLSKNHITNNTGVLSQHYGGENCYIVGGSNNLDGGIFEWAKHACYGDSYNEKYIFSIMEEEAEQSTVGSRGLILLPYLLGERFPFYDEKFRGLFFGIERFHTRNDIMRSIFESSAFMIKSMISSIEKTGMNIKNIRVSGGGSKLNLLCKIRADVTNKEIIQLDESETTSLGAFLIMLKSLGKIKSFKEFKRRIKVKTIYRPDKKANYIYEKIFNFFMKLYGENKRLFDEKHLLTEELENDKIKFELENL